MRQLLVLLVIIGVGYLIYTQGLPKWEAQKAAEAADRAEADRSVECVNSAQEVVRDFTSGMRQFSTPPVDRTMWGSMLLQVGGSLSSAESACSCPTPACDKGGAALHQLRGLLNDLDRFVRDAGPPVLDAPSRIDSINRLLVSARTAAASG